MCLVRLGIDPSLVWAERVVDDVCLLAHEPDKAMVYPVRNGATAKGKS
jgi:hypothetical protein